MIKNFNNSMKQLKNLKIQILNCNKLIKFFLKIKFDLKRKLKQPNNKYKKNKTNKLKIFKTSKIQNKKVT